jgi:translation elongation factor EF-Ts
MRLRKQKSRKDQVTDLAIDYLKLKAATKAAKGAGKAGKKAAKGTAVYKVAKKTPFVKRIPVIVGAGVAAVVATKVVKGRGDAHPAT